MCSSAHGAQIGVVSACCTHIHTRDALISVIKVAMDTIVMVELLYLVHGQLCI